MGIAGIAGIALRINIRDGLTGEGGGSYERTILVLLLLLLPILSLNAGVLSSGYVDWDGDQHQALSWLPGGERRA